MFFRNIFCVVNSSFFNCGSTAFFGIKEMSTQAGSYGLAKNLILGVTKLCKLFICFLGGIQYILTRITSAQELLVHGIETVTHKICVFLYLLSSVIRIPFFILSKLLVSIISYGVFFYDTCYVILKSLWFLLGKAGDLLCVLFVYVFGFVNTLTSAMNIVRHETLPTASATETDADSECSSNVVSQEPVG